MQDHRAKGISLAPRIAAWDSNCPSEENREARRKERSEIAFAGQKVSALSSDYQALLDAVKAHLSEGLDFFVLIYTLVWT